MPAANILQTVGNMPHIRVNRLFGPAASGWIKSERANPGATLAAIAQKLPDLPAGSRVLGFNYDTGERYLSIEGFLPA